MKNLSKILVLTAFIIGFSFEYPKAGAQAQTVQTEGVRRGNCQNDSRVADRCFFVRGSITNGNGNPATRIRVRNTKRIFGVKEDEQPILPANVASVLTSENEVSGNFYVCPFDKYRRGRMQTGCVESASNLKVKN